MIELVDPYNNLVKTKNYINAKIMSLEHKKTLNLNVEFQKNVDQEIEELCLLYSKYKKICDEIVIDSLRELPHDYAKKEIMDYIQNVGRRKVYISELAEKLRLDIELIMDIMDELGAKKKT